MDLISEDQQTLVFTNRANQLKNLSHPHQITAFKTSIWDESLYRAWSAIVYALVPNVKQLESKLDAFCIACEAVEVVLFERTTFLFISHSTTRTDDNQYKPRDIHRFEKISNIVKQFKLSCGRNQAQFQSMEIRTSKFAAYFETLTANTYVMVVLSNTAIQSALTLINIKQARVHFEGIEEEK